MTNFTKKKKLRHTPTIRKQQNQGEGIKIAKKINTKEKNQKSRLFFPSFVKYPSRDLRLESGKDQRVSGETYERYYTSRVTGLASRVGHLRKHTQTSDQRRIITLFRPVGGYLIAYEGKGEDRSGID